MADVQEIRSGDVLRGKIRRGIESLGSVIRDQESTIRFGVSAVLAGGHILLEDVPGVGKTSLARGLASVLGLDFHRIQFTSDLLPADIVGGLALDSQTNQLAFRKGPIFTSMVLADELNRASPRTQSALLEAMEETTVSNDGVTHPLPEPFCVFATQNPLEQHGTYPLPESQLDRFMISMSLGYPSERDEAELLIRGAETQYALSSLKSETTPSEVIEIKKSVESIRVAPEVAQYASQFLQASRSHPEIHLGGSTRGGLSWLMMARAWAWLEDRDYVTPDDLQLIAHSVWQHRFVMKTVVSGTREHAADAVDSIFSQLTPPC